MKFQPKRFLRYQYLRLIRIKDAPKKIARGTAIGIFTGIMPIFPLHSLAILILVPILRANLIAAFIASITVCNPLTNIPQYYFSWLIGNFFTNNNLSWERVRNEIDLLFSHGSYSDILQSLSHLGTDTVIDLMIGGIVIATPFAFLAYYGSLRFFINISGKSKNIII